jgi:predicted patatin/cPLA2 family phospholipase
MRALVISGGGSKGAFAGGVAQYLMQEEGRKYDIFLGTSTGSLLVPHLALGEFDRLYENYSNVNQRTIFSVNPFIKKKRGDREFIGINHFNVLWQFLKGKRTFGESKNLRRLIKRTFTREDFKSLQESPKKIAVAVSNLSLNRTEMKDLDKYTYDEFCDWIWISCNYVPFMSLVVKNECEYADGGLSCSIPIKEAIDMGATEVDAIILETEKDITKRTPGKNPFSLMMSLYDYVLDQMEYNDVLLGKLAAENKHVKLNLFYTPTKLTDNSLIFNKKQMKQWWHDGFKHAKTKCQKAAMNELK